MTSPSAAPGGSSPAAREPVELGNNELGLLFLADRLRSRIAENVAVRRSHHAPAPCARLAEQSVRDAVSLYSTDNLRRLYQWESDEEIRICDGSGQAIIKRGELRDEIWWRLWWDRWVSWITLLAAVVGAVAAIVAAGEGWKTINVNLRPLGPKPGALPN